MWKQADTDGNGSVSKEEFFALERISKLPDDKRAKIFERLDKNNDGSLTRDELGQAGKGHRPMPRLEELDKDKSGGVSFEEFSAAEFVQKLPDERRQEMFKRMDRDGDGQVTAKDRPKPDERDMPRWAELDKDKSGGVSFEEFSASDFAQKMPEERRQAFFKRMDRDGDGQVGPQDKPKQDEHREGAFPRLAQLDKDQSGGVSFEEFSGAEFNQNLQEERRREIFKRLDRDGDGQLTQQDRPVPNDREGKRDGGPPNIKELVGKLDANQDGALSFEEYKQAPFAANWSEDKQEERFQALDRNKDNKIDAADAPPPGERPQRREGPPPPPKGDEQRPQGPPPGDDSMMEDE